MFISAFSLRTIFIAVFFFFFFKMVSIIQSPTKCKYVDLPRGYYD